MTAPLTQGRMSMSFTAKDGRVVTLKNVQVEPNFAPVSGPLPDAKTIEMTFTAEIALHLDPPWKRELLWATHNLIAHPLSEIMHWLAYIPGLSILRDLGLKLHDKTVPRHVPGTGRG